MNDTNNPPIPTPAPLAPPAPNVNPSFKFPKPDNLTGNDRTAKTIDNWIFAVEQYLTGNNLPLDTPRTITIAAAFLTDAALQFWRMYATNHPTAPEKSDFNLFATLVRNRFYPVDYILNLRTKLDKIRQTGTAQLYNQTFEEILYQIPGDQWTDGDMKDKYLRGLRNDVMVWVLMQGPTTLLDAMQSAERTDQIILQARNLGANQTINLNPLRSTDTSSPMEVDNFSTFRAPSGRPYRGYNNQNSNTRRNGNKPNFNAPQKCYNCGILGHLSRDCRRPLTDASRRAQCHPNREMNHIDAEEGGQQVGGQQEEEEQDFHDACQ